MRKTIFTIILAGVASSASFAQMNLVNNPGFEMVEKKPKSLGNIEMASSWNSPSEENKADLFHKKSKKDVGIPANKYGNLEMEEGLVYAGFRAFGDKGRMPRTYLQTKLSKPMVAGKTYCVKMDLALGKLSKYAINNIGMYVSVKKPKGKDLEKGVIKPQVIHSKNRVIDDRDMFIPLCRTYTAEGGERYLTIGNFKLQTALKKNVDYIKMKRPKGMQGMQIADSYYYVDNVSVINMEELETCACEKADPNANMDVVYSENVSELEDMKEADKISLNKVFFEPNATKATSPGPIVEVIRILKEDPSIKLEIVGHSDKKEEETDMGNISELRAKGIYDYLIKKGIPESQISYKGLKNMQPVDKAGTNEARAKNRRVEFKVK